MISDEFEAAVAKEMKLLAQEKKNAYFAMLYGGTISAEKVHKLLDITFEGGAALTLVRWMNDETGWLAGGHRDFRGGLLCYDCAEELIGPGAGEVNDLRSKDPDRPISMLVCNWCGPGRFNALGERTCELTGLISGS